MSINFEGGITDDKYRFIRRYIKSKEGCRKRRNQAKSISYKKLSWL